MPLRKRTKPLGKQVVSSWAPWAYAVVCAPLVLLLVELMRGALHETQSVGAHVLLTHMQELRSQALERRTGLEVLLESHHAEEQPWDELNNEPWLAAYWSNIQLAPHQLYAAVVDDAGRIVMHTDRARIGHRLERGWYDRRVSEAGPDVVWTQRSALGGDRPTYGVMVPIHAVPIHAAALRAVPIQDEEQPLGEYHEGVDGQWLDSQVKSRQRATLSRWLAVIAVMGAVDAAAIGALLFLARRQARLTRRLHEESRKRARELSQIGSGLAHEIRNPLHALRINLHTLRRSFGSRSPLGEDQILATIQDSNAAIERLDGLMRDLLQFSDPSAAKVADVDLVHEVRSTLNLVGEQLRRDQIQVHAQLPEEPAPVAIDPVRLRQTLLNLITFAQHRAGKNGTIDVGVARREGGVEIALSDSGPSLPEDQQTRVFEPFQAPVETGSGLGLALVQACAEEAGGRAAWDASGAAHGRCLVWLPLSPSGSKGSL